MSWFVNIFANKVQKQLLQMSKYTKNEPKGSFSLGKIVKKLAVNLLF